MLVDVVELLCDTQPSTKGHSTQILQKGVVRREALSVRGVLDGCMMAWDSVKKSRMSVSGAFRTPQAGAR